MDITIKLLVETIHRSRSQTSKYRKQYLRETVDRYRERKNYDRALSAVAELSKDDPLNSDLFRIVSEIYASKEIMQPWF